MMVARGFEEWEDFSTGYKVYRVQTFIYKMNKFWGFHVQHDDCS